jgi:hypothetical protein
MKGRRLAGRRLDRLLAQQRTHKVYNSRSAVAFLIIRNQSAIKIVQHLGTLGQQKKLSKIISSLYFI